MKKVFIVLAILFAFCSGCTGNKAKKTNQVIYGPNKHKQILQLTASDCAVTYRKNGSDDGFVSLMDYDGNFFSIPGFPLDLAYPKKIQGYENWSFRGAHYYRVESRLIEIEGRKINATVFKKESNDYDGYIQFFFLSEEYGLLGVAYDKDAPLLVNKLAQAIKPLESKISVCKYEREQRQTQ